MRAGRILGMSRNTVTVTPARTAVPARIVVADAAWGLTLLLAEGRLLRAAAGRDPSPVERVAATALGGRLVVQSLALQVRPSLAPTVTAVEAAHAASMAVLGAVSPRHRRVALLSGTVAAILALDTWRSSQ
jgi:hypothetical protein